MSITHGIHTSHVRFRHRVQSRKSKDSLLLENMRVSTPNIYAHATSSNRCIWDQRMHARWHVVDPPNVGLCNISGYTCLYLSSGIPSETHLFDSL